MRISWWPALSSHKSIVIQPGEREEQNIYNAQPLDSILLLSSPSPSPSPCTPSPIKSPKKESIGHRTMENENHNINIAMFNSSCADTGMRVAFKFWEFHCIFKTVKKSLIVLARQNKLWEGINSMAIIESEMISHEQLILSSQGH